jgi:hypothetical protein
MRTIGNDERRARLGKRHCLAEPSPGVAEVAGAMVGLHSSDPATVFLSARARIPGLKQGDVEDALYERRSVVRILAMRRTMFVVPVEMAPLLHYSSTISLIAPEQKRLADMVEKAGIAADGAEWVRRVSEHTLDALRARGEAVATELTKDVPELGERITFYKSDGSVLTTVGMSTRVLFLLATEGRIVRGRPKGTWVSSLYRWVPTETWLGAPLTEMDKPDAQAALLTKWLGTFGPATERDIRWWTGWAAVQVRKALARIGAIQVEVESGPAFVLADDIEPVAPVDRWVALLPSLDPTTMGWKERGWYLGPHAGRLFDSNGNAGQTVWVDGKIVGGWGQRKDGEVVWHLLEDVDRAAAGEIARQASELQEWIGDRVVVARFRSPLDKDLGDR